MENINYRNQSIIDAETIGVSLKGISTFELNTLNNVALSDVIFSKNLRLGKQVEKIVSGLITSSSNYEVLKENIQIIDDKITVGELDFIIKNLETNQISHLELVYKFYLYDPNNSTIELEKWIGPNRKDSYIKKFEKLKNKQFPLLYKTQTANYLEGIDIAKLDQKLCFMATLFVPYTLLGNAFSLINNKAIVGYWHTLNEFKTVKNQATKYYLPQKTEWGINPKFNNEWMSYSSIIELIRECHSRDFSPLCWVKKENNSFEQCFIVWW